MFVAAVGLVILLLPSAAFSQTENSSCLSCHATGNTSPQNQVDFHVASVDRLTACVTCHNSGITATHANIVSTPYGYFQSIYSPTETWDYVHLVHTSGGGGCASGCHGQAACTVCHPKSIPHNNHSVSPTSGVNFYPPVSYMVADGVGFVTTLSACVNPACHGDLRSLTPRPQCISCHPGREVAHGGGAHTVTTFSSSCYRSCHESTNTLIALHAPYAASTDPTATCAICHGGSNPVAPGHTFDCFSCHYYGSTIAVAFAANHAYRNQTSHVSTVTACMGTKCHVKQIDAVHERAGTSPPDDCSDCHRVTFTVIGNNPRDCLQSACHSAVDPAHSWTKALTGGGTVADRHATTQGGFATSSCVKATCHVSSNIFTEHQSWSATFTCGTCHGSTSTTVAAAITAGNTTCDGCHSLSPGHGTGYNAAMHAATESAGAGVNDCFQAGCHVLDLETEHAKWTTDFPQHASVCEFCHTGSPTKAESVAPWNRQCQACHQPHVVREPFNSCPVCHGNLHETTSHAGVPCATCHAIGAAACTLCHTESQVHGFHNFTCTQCHLSGTPYNNRGPIAMAGRDQTTTPGSLLTFDGTASFDPDGTITAYGWDFGDNTTATGARVAHTYIKNGQYVVKLTVTDNLGAKGIDYAAVYVTTATVTTAEYPYDAATYVQKLAATTGADSAGSRTDVTAAMKDNKTTTYYEISNVKTNNGYKVIGLKANKDATAYNKVVLRLYVNGYTSGGDSARVYAYNSNGDSVNTTAYNTFSVASTGWQLWDVTNIAAKMNGFGWMKFRLVSAKTYYRISEARIQLSQSTIGPAPNIAPVAEAGPNKTVHTGAAATMFGGNSYDPDGTITAFGWNFGDGTAGTGVSPQHTWSTVGTYIVTLTVTDNVGRQATDTCTVKVSSYRWGYTN
jgi:PKD repeat protein